MIYITPKHNLTFLLSSFYFSRSWKMISQLWLRLAKNRRSSGSFPALQCTALLVRLSRVHLSPPPHHHPYAPNARHATDFTFDQPNLSPPPHHHPYAPIAPHATDFTFDQPNLSSPPHHHPYAPIAPHATDFTFDQPNLSPPPHHHPYAPNARHATDFTFDQPNLSPPPTTTRTPLPHHTLLTLPLIL